MPGLKDVQEDGKTSMVKRKVKGAGQAVARFKQLAKDRARDPFGPGAEAVILDMKEGMETLLEMHNTVELNSLCGALSLPVACTNTEKKQNVMEYIKLGRNGDKDQVERRFAEAVRLVWEGLLYEYLRSIGHPLRGVRQDPRHFVLRYWRRSQLDPTGKGSFVPMYLERRIKPRNNITKVDKDISDIRRKVMNQEAAVKKAEGVVLREHDYRHVLFYLGACRDLHKGCVSGVEYLANEVEMLRAWLSHKEDTVHTMEEQMVELEDRYTEEVGGLEATVSEQRELEAALRIKIGNKAEEEAAVRNAIGVLIRDMDLGPNGRCISESQCPSSNLTDGNNSPDAFMAQWPGPAHPEDVSEAPVVRFSEVGDVHDAASLGDISCVTFKQKDEIEVPEDTEDPKNAEGEPELSAVVPKGDAAVPQAGAEEVDAVDSPEVADEKEPPLDDMTIADLVGLVDGRHQAASLGYKRQVAALTLQAAAQQQLLKESEEMTEAEHARALAAEACQRKLEEQLEALEESTRRKLKIQEMFNETARRDVESLLRQRSLRLAACRSIIETLLLSFCEGQEELGLSLYRALGMGDDEFSHVSEGKLMFGADLESQANEMVEALRKPAKKGTKKRGANKSASPKGKGKGKAPASPKGKGKTASKATSPKGGAASKPKASKAASPKAAK
ncbi:unnamed protein product, partial [Chrysoparadoxa australica]